MSDPDQVLLCADEDCDDDREPVTVHTLKECRRAVDDLVTGGPPVAMSSALSDEWDQDQLEEQAMLAKLGHL